MFACVDVGYQGSLARAACLTFDNWSDATPSDEIVLDSGNVQPYVPGQFYKRELPYLKAIVEQLPARPEAIVIDGYVWLDDTGERVWAVIYLNPSASRLPSLGLRRRVSRPR